MNFGQSFGFKKLSPSHSSSANGDNSRPSFIATIHNTHQGVWHFKISIPIYLNPMKYLPAKDSKIYDCTMDTTPSSIPNWAPVGPNWGPNGTHMLGLLPSYRSPLDHKKCSKKPQEEAIMVHPDILYGGTAEYQSKVCYGRLGFRPSFEANAHLQPPLDPHLCVL